MATTQEIDAAVALLASTRVAFAQAQAERAKCVTLRDIAAANLTAATSTQQQTRDAMQAARTSLLTLLAQPET